MGLSQYQADLLDKTSSYAARNKLGRKLMREVKQVAVYEYDFSKDGGASGDITLRSLDGEKIPDNAVIQNAWLDILTAMASSGGTGTIALKVESSEDILAAVDADTLSDQHQGVPDYATVGDWVKTTDKQDVVATIATEDLTDGKFLCFVEYCVSE